MADWEPIPISNEMFRNLSEGAVLAYQAAIENGFINGLGGQSRFPGLVERVALPDSGRVYLHDYRDNLIACTGRGQVFEIDRQYRFQNRTGVPVSGGRRVIFTKTDTDLLMAAGGPIIQLRTKETELLSEDAPNSTYIQWIDNYTIAAEVNSGRFYHSNPADPKTWDPIDSFAADSSPDNIANLLITPFREIMIGGTNSLEQFERVLSGEAPFQRRWANGDGVLLPYACLFADNAFWAMNNLTEFVRTSGQISQVKSKMVSDMLQKIDNWEDAWLGGFPDRPLHIAGQTFMLLQAPKASNGYGSKGVTLLLDYTNERWYELYGWDTKVGIPKRWPGWSHWTLWGKLFVGGEGKVYELVDGHHRNGDDIQRWLVRTGLLTKTDAVDMTDFRLMLERGSGTNSEAGDILVRCSRDGRPFGPWIRKSLGLAGDRYQYASFGSFGAASSFRFEISCGDNFPFNLIKAEYRGEYIEV
jgi:hypothetical protein